jgi:hypothetical protein
MTKYGVKLTAIDKMDYDDLKDKRTWIQNRSY